MSEVRKILERALRGPLVQPGIVTSLAEMSDPQRKPNFSQLLGITRVTPESQAPTPATGPDQAGGGSE